MHPASRLYRPTLLFLILVMLTLCLPQVVDASPASAVTLTFDVIAVKADQSVTIRTKAFPVRTHFTVRMALLDKQTITGKPADTAKLGANGEVVGELETGQGGTLEATYKIPASLRGKVILALRFESRTDYLGANWFFNENWSSPVANTEIKPAISFADAKKNTSVAVTARGLPANTKFTVRVGPFYTFYRNYVFTQDVLSAADGTAKFTLNLQKNTFDADYIMVRLDNAGTYLYNVYKNEDGGAAVPVNSLYKFEWCKVIDISPVPALAPKEEFDVAWTVQNTSNLDWLASRSAYRYMSGEAMHKYEDFHSLGFGPKNGAVFKITLDMIAPSQPGWHTTTWAMINPRDEITMCHLKISVFVKGQ